MSHHSLELSRIAVDAYSIQIILNKLLQASPKNRLALSALKLARSIDAQAESLLWLDEQGVKK